MPVSVDIINQFHHMRTDAHVQCLNYYAGLLGYHFPEHDNDKHIGTMKNGYAYINWAKYHPEYVVPETYRELFNEMHAEHHRMQEHHLEHYDNVADIDDLTLVEMICDWHSASFEQRFLTHEDKNDFTVRRWFDANLYEGYQWSQHQLQIIYDLIEFIEMYANYNEIMKIWQPLLDF